MAGALVALAIASGAGLLQGAGSRSLAETLFGPVLLVVWSHGLEPRPAWNHLPEMFSAIAGSPKVFALPCAAIALGLLGRCLADSGVNPDAAARLARGALRQSRAGQFSGATAALMLLGLLIVSRLI